MNERTMIVGVELSRCLTRVGALGGNWDIPQLGFMTLSLQKL